MLEDGLSSSKSSTALRSLTDLFNDLQRSWQHLIAKSERKGHLNTWHKNCYSILCGWAADNQVEEGSLEAFEDTMIGLDLESTLEAIQEWVDHCRETEDNESLEVSSTDELLLQLLRDLQEHTPVIRMKNAIGSSLLARKARLHDMASRIALLSNYQRSEDISRETSSHLSIEQSESEIDSLGPANYGARVFDLMTNEQTQDSSAPFFDCCLSFLPCIYRFQEKNEWEEHCLAHFGEHGPPPNGSRCPLCSWQVRPWTLPQDRAANYNKSLKEEGARGDERKNIRKDRALEMWNIRQQHVSQHYLQGDSHAATKPDSELILYLHQKRIISGGEYMVLSRDENSFLDFLRERHREDQVIPVSSSESTPVASKQPGNSSKRIRSVPEAIMKSLGGKQVPVRMSMAQGGKLK